MNRKLLWLLFGAFLLCLVAVNQSLWLDEGTTARVVMQYSFFDIITKFSVFDFHPPLFYLLMKIWTMAAGYSELALRIPSILFSLICGYYIYLIGRHLKDESAGLWAAAFFLFNPLIMYYSQEARMYLMTCAFLSAALYYFVTLGPGIRNRRGILLCNIFLFLSFITFYGSIFFIGAILGWLIVRRKWRKLMVLSIGPLAAMLLVSPLLTTQLNHSREALQIVKNWSLVLGKVTLKNLALVPLKFSVGRIQFLPKSLYYVVGGLWTLGVIITTIVGTRKRSRMTFMLVAPLAAGTLFSFFTPLLQYFRFLYLIIPLSLLLAFGTRKQWHRYALVGGFIVWSLVYLWIPQFHREDWKSLGMKLSQRETVYIIPSSSDALGYYRPDVQIHDIRTLDAAAAKTVTVVPYTADIYGYPYASVLVGKNYVLADRREYRGVLLEQWKKR